MAAQELPYGNAITEHFRRPRNYGPLHNATASGECVNPLCGDRIRVAVLIESGVIAQARFTANACAICVAAASLLTERLRGMSSDVATRLAEADIFALVEADVPAGRRRCATLPLEALHRALAAMEGEWGGGGGRRATSVDMMTAVLLAAGNARRFDGRQKLLASVPTRDGRVPLIRYSVGGLLEAGLRNIVVVTGRDADSVRDSLDGVDVRFVFNPEYASGLSTSLKTGVSEALRLWPTLTHVLVALGDQPLSGTGILERLLSIRRAPDEGEEFAIVAPRYRGELGNPALFSREFIPDLLREPSGDRGARALIERNPSRVRYVDFNCAMPVDVDTVGDLADLTDVHDE